jgi:hypothetical protein
MFSGTTRAHKHRDFKAAQRRRGIIAAEGSGGNRSPSQRRCDGFR